MELKIESLSDLVSENRDIFYKELKSVIKPNFDGLDNPEKYKDVLLNTLNISPRPMLLRQARVVAAATEYLKDNKSILISAEMGTGKTEMAIKISMAKTLKPVFFIVCPPHLVGTWEEELALNYKNKNSYRVIRIKRWDDLIPYTNRNLSKDGVRYYFIITRENLKLSYPKRIAAIERERIITRIEKDDDEEYEVREKIRAPHCPDCGIHIEEGRVDKITKEFIYVVPKLCPNCGTKLRTQDKRGSERLQTREAVVDYIFKRFKKGSFNLILDEVHEYKGGDTGQGNAMGRIASQARKVIGLTGTLMNGYASSLFYLLYRLNPSLMKRKLGFNYNQVKDFVATYGAQEEIVEAKEVDEEGILTRRGKRLRIKEKPKISPLMLSILLEMTIFLKLDEIKMPNNLKLPPYEEIVDLVEMESRIRENYLGYLDKIIAELRYDKRLLGRLAVDAIAIPDMPFNTVVAKNGIAYIPEYTRESFPGKLTNKEKRLIENIKVEIEKGRKCLVYITFSNQQVATDLENILKEAFPQKTIRFLPSTVQPAKRKDWISKNSCDILIANPELVKTGLTLLEFTTIIFYETTYNIFTLKQASRRSWRIGQREPIKVIFMAYKDTPQHKALELIGMKIKSANSLEGRLSGEDDLSNMADDDDNIQLALARAILRKESSTKEIKLTSYENFGDERDFDNFEKYYQKLLDASPKQNITIDVEEVKTDREEQKRDVNTTQKSKNDSLFDFFSNTKKEESSKEADNKVAYVAIIGKGKKAKRVEYSSAEALENLLDGSTRTKGVQLAFAF